MSKKDIDNYLAAINEPKKSTLEALRKTILEISPRAEQCITYGVPTFKVEGKAVAGFAAYKNHCSYFPMSGSVLNRLQEDVANYATSRGTLQFAPDKPLPKTLVKKLIKVRLAQAFPDISVGTRPGRTVERYSDGSIKARGFTLDGELHGKWQWFRKDGSIMRSGEFNLGRQVGAWRTYTRSGKIHKETKFS